ncbi:unnamed protein product [Pleuronectes platessa]|uniref:Uncharacterized protein n=1 Tax=Pleuronectes platessa TaxID=8262 RepID=A0A9N7Z8T2_PLEPL|nr:unnamed protein product [Pleuronectes platessa]
MDRSMAADRLIVPKSRKSFKVVHINSVPLSKAPYSPNICSRAPYMAHCSVCPAPDGSKAEVKFPYLHEERSSPEFSPLSTFSTCNKCQVEDIRNRGGKGPSE